MSNKKGILLTLAMIVLFVLMLGELITYLVLNINYDQLASGTSASFSSASFLSFVNSGSASFLAVSLNNSLGALTLYESTPSLRQYNTVNSTQYALVSLMTNGTIYGTNMNGYMGNAILQDYVSSLQRWAGTEGGTLVVSNVTISIYQSNPFYISASMKGLATLNTSFGTTNYPIEAVANVSINGTQDLAELQAGNPTVVKAYYQPTAQLVGNTYAIAGSTSPYLFAYAPVIFIGGTPTCSSIPSQFTNGNYILVTQNAIKINKKVCGMAGLVANTVNSSLPVKPYLVYANSVISNTVIGNGTSLLLNGAGLSLVDPSGLQSAIRNSYYLQSSYAPSYIQDAEGQASRSSGAGIVPFGMLNRVTASFSSSSNILVPQTLTGNAFTVTMWVDPTGALGTAGTMTIFNSMGSNALNFNVITGSGTSLPEDLIVGPNQRFPLPGNLIGNSWNFLAVTSSNGLASIYTGQAGNVTVSVFKPPYSLTDFQLGGSGLGAGAFTGNMSNIQIYTNALTPGQISSIYLNGLDGSPIQNASLAIWYPLNGNTRDYSGVDNFNGIPTNIVYNQLAGYTADPIFKNSPTTYNSSVVKGVLNCANINQCANTSQSHLYLGGRTFGTSKGVGQDEITTLGIANGLLPDGIDFLSSGAQVRTASGYNGLSAYTIGLWLYPQGPSGSLNNLITTLPANEWNIGLSGGTGISAECAGNTFTSGATISYNTWQFLTVTCTAISGYQVQVYLNGSIIGSGAGTTPSTLPTINSLIIGNSVQFGGIVSDVQLYNGVLNSSQVLQLYLNNTVNGITPLGYWPLSSPFNGLANQTQDIAHGNTGLFYSGNVICSVSNTVSNACGAMYRQT